MVIALILIGGTTENRNLAAEPGPAGIGAHAAFRFVDDPARLYGRPDQHVGAVSGLAAAAAPASPVVADGIAIGLPDTQRSAPAQGISTVALTSAVAAASIRVAETAIEGHATAYGPAYNGSPLGCGGVYSSDDPTIAAVGPERYAEWPCGTRLQVCGQAGCLIVTRQDACPGCYAGLVDLSEAGNAAVCGTPPHTCRVTIRLVLEP